MTPRDLFTLDALHPWLTAHDYHPRDLGLLDAALNRPWATFAGKPLYPDPWTKTAAVISSIEANHPLVDGNKRLGVLLGSLMLHSHGIDHRQATDDDWFTLITTVATTHPDIDTLADHLRTLHTPDHLEDTDNDH
jgi:death-on-curing protein